MQEYWLLFISGFVSSTLFPGGSEVLFVYYLKQAALSDWWLFSVVTIGNTFGAITTFLLGYYIRWGQTKAALKYPYLLIFCKRWGNWALLLSWLPIIGDVLCLFAGWLKLSKTTAFLFMLIGKSARYFIIMMFII